MQACLRDAGASPADLGYINLHGTGTPTGDPVEVAAVHQALGEHATRVPVSSTKSMHGHLLGAAGAVELLAPILALRDGLIAPTAHLTDPDPAFDLDFVPCTARTGVRMDLAMSSNFAFGGSNVCLLLAR
jgi:3-oxoacyl-(acyl-carrier-protein) synthase